MKKTEKVLNKSQVAKEPGFRGAYPESVQRVHPRGYGKKRSYAVGKGKNDRIPKF